MADERARVEAVAAPKSATPTSAIVASVEVPEVKAEVSSKDSLSAGIPAVETAAPETSSEQAIADQPQPSIEVSYSANLQHRIVLANLNQTSTISGAADAEAVVGQPIQNGANNHDDGVPHEGKQENASSEQQRPQDGAEQELSQANVVENGAPNGMAGNSNFHSFPNMMNMNMNMGFNNNMDYNQMMQYMSANGMGNFNNMMGSWLLNLACAEDRLTILLGMPNMGLGPVSQGMFGGFGGPGGMAGMNGMNMGMNFNPNQGMYGAGWNSQNNNMWNGSLNNNPNAFSNGMGGDYGPNSGYGYNVPQQGNFHQQQYPSNDFQNQNGYNGRGFGRGRGRGRGGYGRGRGSYSQHMQGNTPSFMTPHEQHQYEIQNMQAQMITEQNDEAERTSEVEQAPQPTDDEQMKQLNDEFAPGGQEEVREALGDDYVEPQADDEPAPIQSIVQEEVEAPVLEAETIQPAEDDVQTNGHIEPVQSIPTLSPTTHQDDAPVVENEPSVDVSQEISEPSMPPPTAPLGPAAHFAEPVRDYGFRGRGHGRYPARGRGSFHMTNGNAFSPVRAAQEQPFNPPTEPKGQGVVGAPTGPKAMRSAPPNGPARGRGGGFQIVGRASMGSQAGQSHTSEQSRR